MKYYKFYLSQFDGEGNNGGTDPAGNGQVATYSLAQAEEIANARAERARNSALKSYFQQQGLDQAGVEAAIAEYKKQQSANAPNIDAITKERDDALKQVADMKNQGTLKSLGVKDEYLEFVTFAINKNVTKDKDFETCAKEYIKANPMYAGGGLRVSTGTEGQNGGTRETKNETINNMIRNSIGRR